MLCHLPHRSPADVEDGYQICRRHQTQMRENLAAIAAVLDDLDMLLVTPTPIDANDVRAAKTDAPAPCRLDVLDLTDPRSDTPAVHLVNCWVVFVAEERHLATHPTRPPDQARWLTLHLDWLTRHPIVVDAYTELGDVWRWLRSAAGMAPPKPVMACPVVHPDTDTECGGPVFPDPYTFAVRCVACGEVWDGNSELRRLGLVDTA